MSDDDIRALMLAHGFTIKEGHDDLKPYVYSAARAVERAARAAAFDEALREIPASWLDPLLSGPDKISPLPYNGPAMERFLHALRDRLRARAEVSNG